MGVWAPARMQCQGTVVMPLAPIEPVLPARAGGITHNISDTVVATVIADGAHHLDLMDSNPEDPASVTAARRSHVRHMQRWLDEYYAGLPA